MKVLVVGSGGREHAIVWSLSKSKKVSKIYCAPGNGGIEALAECVPISVMDFEKLAGFVQENAVDVTIIGMDDPLVHGVVDYFEQRGLKVFGPRKNAAILEGSKVFSKNLMKKYNIPTAAYETFSSPEAALAYLEKQKLPIVIKADGLALGKGVLICETMTDAENAIKEIMQDKKFGDSGNNVVIEEFMTGPEMSLLCFCDGKTIVPMVSAQDYKRAFDNNEGLNTGGMGTISPSPQMDEEAYRFIYDNICIPTVAAMQAEGRPFKGVIYLGLMCTPNGIKVIEYNARLGDPETQVLFPRLETDLAEIVMAVIEERLDELELSWTDNAACCVVLASGGYPEGYQKGYEITGIDEAEKTALVFHAGTAKKDGKIITAGGRVLGVTGLGKTIAEARECAYAAAEKINFEGKQFRTDIGRL